MVQRRQLLTLGAATAAAAFGSASMGGCSGFTNSSTSAPSGGTSGTRASGKPSPQTLMCWADPKEKSLFEKTLAKFTASTGIDVKVVSVASSDYFKKINAMSLAGTLPDVFWGNNSSGVVQPMAANNQLYDWTGMLDSPPADAPLSRDKFGPGYLDLYTVDGKVIALPNEVNVNGIYYNKKAFTDAGVTLPTAAWTWDDMFDAAKKLTTKKGGKVSSYGLVTGQLTIDDPFGTSMYSQSNGGPGLAGDQSTTWQNIQQIQAGPKFIEGAGRFVDTVKSGAINGPDFSTNNSIASFMNGDLPMLYGGQWFTAFFAKKLKDDWGYVTMPKGSAGWVSILQANAFCSPADLKDPVSTWKLIQYMLTTGFNDAYAEIGITPIAYTPGSEGFFSFMAKKGKSETGYNEVATGVKADLANPMKSATAYLDKWSNRAEDVIKAVWNPMLNGKTPVDKAVQDYVKRLQAFIK